MYTGIFILFFLFLFYGLSFLSYRHGNIKLALVAIILAGLGLRLFCALDPMLHPWDERYHGLVAKNMMTDPFVPKLYPEQVLSYDYKNWTANYVWLHKQPLPLWTMAASMKIFGVSEFTLRLPSILLSTFSIFLTFWIGRFLSSSERVGLLAAFFLSINGLVIELASGRVSTDHVDTFFMLLILMSLFFILLNVKRAKKIWLTLAGVFCGLAILTKWLPGLIVFPLYLIINFKHKKYLELFLEMVWMLFVTILVALPWQWYAYANFPLEYNWEQDYNTLHLFEGLEGHGQPWWYFIDRIRITINELIYLVFGWFVFQIFKSKKINKEHLFLLTWLLIPFLIFSAAATKMQGYLLFTFPGWFIVMGMFIEKLLTVQPTSSKLKKGYLLIVGAMMILALRYGLERVKPLEDHSAERSMKIKLTQKKYSPNTVLFGVEHPIEWMFYNEGLAYPMEVEQGVKDSLKAEGWLVY